MSWIKKCDQCQATDDGYFLREPWIVAEESLGVFSVKVRETKERSFVVPELPGLGLYPRSGLAGSSSSTKALDTRHLCSMECLKAYIEAKLTPPAEKSEVA